MRCRFATKQLDELRTEMMNLKVQLPQMQERIKGFEAELGNEQDPARRNQLEAELKAFKQMHESQVSRQQQLQEREAQLTAQLQVEQSTLSSLTDQLQEIEREIERQMAEAKPSPALKD
jgi:predicted  nucleic acid-binding Zn-ribbon protein